MAETGSDPAENRLTARQQRFVEEMIANGGNQAQAAVVAGYSPKSARMHGSRLMTNVNVSRAVALGRQTLAERCGLTAERVIREVVALAFSDQRNYLVDPATGVMTLAPGVPIDAHRAVSSVKRRTMVMPDGTTSTEMEFKLWNKPEMVRLAGKHLGLEGFADRVELDAKNLTAPTVNVYTGISPPADAEPDDGRGEGAI